MDILLFINQSQSSLDIHIQFSFFLSSYFKQSTKSVIGSSLIAKAISILSVALKSDKAILASILIILRLRQQIFCLSLIVYYRKWRSVWKKLCWCDNFSHDNCVEASQNAYYDFIIIFDCRAKSDILLSIPFAKNALEWRIIWTIVLTLKK